MKNRHNRSIFKGVLCGVSVTLACTALIQAQVQEDPDLEPEYNVARSSWGSGLLYINDVVLESESPDPLLNDKIDLIHDDETLSSDIPEGRSVFLVSLKDSSIVNSFRFYNFDAEGAVMAYVRTTATEDNETPWIPVSDTVTYGEVGPVVVWFNQEIEASLVRIVFDTSKSGHISGFGVAGSFSVGSARSRLSWCDRRKPLIIRP